MEDRLKHKYDGQLRAMQMSKCDNYFIVEGNNIDRFFYSSLCKKSLPGIKYKFINGHQLTGDAGGKEVLLSFYDFLKAKKSLPIDYKGKNANVVFFLDKDIDDLRRRKRKSKYVIYTEYYDVENYIYKYGNIVIGASSAASVDVSLLDSCSDSEGWCKVNIEHWKLWIVLCLCFLELGIRCEVKYSNLSFVQSNSGNFDKKKYDDIVNDISGRCRYDKKKLELELEKVHKRVNRYFKENKHHLLFKGKWFSEILSCEIDRLMSGVPYSKQGLSKKLPNNIASTLDFDAGWTRYFKSKILEAINLN